MTDSPPLYKLFTSLRMADIPLGIGEYKLLLTALEGGFGISKLEDGFDTPKLEALRNLCKTLWIKSEDDLRTFERIFPRIMQQAAQDSSPNDDSRSTTQGQDTFTGPLSEQPSSQKDTSPNISPSSEQLAVQAVLSRLGTEELPYRKFVRSDEYFPVTRRQMKQSWRYLRHPIREGPPVELDIEKTIEDIGRQGSLLEPIVLPRYVNRAEVLLLIDQGGSMVPFHLLSKRLAETALRGGRLSNASIYYFHNYPLDRLFLSPDYQEDILLSDIMNNLHYERSSMLIFSDAGAARGHFSQQRYERTESFLKQMKEHVHYQAWLNPMPTERWTDTTAESIARLTSMFDISRKGLERAINVLRGRYTA